MTRARAEIRASVSFQIVAGVRSEVLSNLANLENPLPRVLSRAEAARALKALEESEGEPDPRYRAITKVIRLCWIGKRVCSRRGD